MTRRVALQVSLALPPRRGGPAFPRDLKIRLGIQLFPYLLELRLDAKLHVESNELTSDH